MKYILVLLLLSTACQTKNPPRSIAIPVPQEHLEETPVDGPNDYVDPNEKHFDCVVNEVITPDRRLKPPYAYVTECGILFYSDTKHKLGDTLKNFQSPKHK